MLLLEQIATCKAVTDDHIRDALSAAKSFSEPSPREKSLALLGRMVAIAKPRTGAPRMLVLLARMAKRDWIEGDLIVRLIGDTELSVLELFADDGVSRERIAGPLRIDVPLAEFADAVVTSPAQFVPLQASERTDRRFELRGTRDLFAQNRKASISAFAFDLNPGLGPTPPGTAQPTQRKNPSFEKLAAVLDMPDELRSSPRPKPVPKKPPPPPRRSGR